MRSLLAVLFFVMLTTPAVALPGPGLNGETTNMIPVVGRVFPEPLQTNDYIGYFEAVQGLKFLNRTYPDRVELIPVGKSVGWTNRITGQKEPNDVYIVEVTNEKSPIPRENRIQLFFMLSIHGNEKGGREGGLRVIEDFAKGNVGLLAPDWQPGLLKMLDYFLLIFAFPNVDGWTHDEPQYYGPGITLYTRANANGVDMNRNWPTQGYMAVDRSHQTLSEPEVKSIVDYATDNYHHIAYASDIHGMLNPADGRTPPLPNPNNPNYASALQAYLTSKENGHFILGMLPAGQMTQLENARQTRLGELIKDRLGAWQGFAAYTAAPSLGPWGGTFVRWGAVWETIGYQVSGGSHDWFVSDRGLNAPSFSFEMSYNHIVCDGVYPGCGEVMNHFHVNSVRLIVATFIEAATKDIQLSFESNGHRAAYLYNPKVWSSRDDRPIEGWAANYDGDDRYQYDNKPYRVTPNDYLADFGPYVRDGDKPAVFDSLQAAEITKESLARYDTFIVAGSAYEQIRGNARALEALKAWAEGGNNLVLTDSALQMAGDLGVVSPDAVAQTQTYMGYTDVVNYRHSLSRDLIGFSRQTFEGVPLGYPHQSRGSPNWYIRADEVRSKGEVVGVVGDTVGPASTQQPNNVNLGILKVGSGKITFLGALLPDPTQEHYHPYGLVSYATTYAGNQFFVNMLDYQVKFDAPPVVLEDLSKGNIYQREGSAPSTSAGTVQEAEPGSTPTVGFAALVAVLAVLVWARRRRA